MSKDRPLTMSQKILAAKAGVDEVEPGQFIICKVDLVMVNDVTAPPAILAFEAAGRKKVFDPQRVIVVLDHFTPNRDVASAEQCALARRFAADQKTLFHEVGRVGIAHVMLPEEGLVRPGDLIMGADSHTCTYGALNAFGTGVGSTDAGAAMATGRTWLKVPESIRVELSGQLTGWATAKDVILKIIGILGTEGGRYQALEFGGPGLKSISVEGRLTIANMAVEAGGKTGLFEYDEQTKAFLDQAGPPPYGASTSEPVQPDEGAAYSRVVDLDLSSLQPVVACPDSPANVVPLGDVRDVKVDQVVIGSCTNGRLSDLAAAAEIIKGRQVASGVRLVVLPGSQRVWLDALKAGYLETFAQAGASVSTPTCGPCLGGHMGVLAAGETCLSTTNRNFRGRMGSPESSLYLASPVVAAATALTGHISTPEDI